MRIILVFVFFLTVFTAKSQNMIIGTNGFVTSNPFQKGNGFGVYTRMGVEVINLEFGIKSFYGNQPQLEAYGISLYSFIPVHRYKKFQVLGHVEGGMSFVFNEFFGSERALQMGFGPALKYNLREYFAFEFVLEYVVFANLSTFDPQVTQLLIPTIGWSVRI